MQGNHLISPIRRLGPQPHGQPRLSRSAGIRETAHVQRVATWCAEIGLKLQLPVADCRALDQAALLHHRNELVLRVGAFDALRRDVGIVAPAHEVEHHYEYAREVLRALHAPQGAPDGIRRLATILEQCDDLDNVCELDAEIAADPDDNALDNLIAEVGGYFRSDAPAAAALHAMESAGTVSHLLATQNLPVFPAVANRVFELLADDNLNFGDLESIISSDQTLAGHIVAAANSAAAGGSSRATSIGQAVSRIGVIAARRVVRASALRGMYKTPQTRALWNHSLDVADAASQIAHHSGAVDVEEAFLSGLMHDLGKLVITELPGEALARHNRLMEAGCPELVIDRVIFGETHASVGAQLLRGWNFADRIAAAVEHHHQPEQNGSPLCSVVYLAEAASLRRETGNGLISEWREELARKTLGISGTVELPGAGTSSALSELRFAAAA